MEPDDTKPIAVPLSHAKASAEHPDSAANDATEEEERPVNALPKIITPRVMERKFAQTTRRELFKVAPVLLLGTFAIPRVQESLLKNGLGFSDWVSARLFRRGYLAPTFADSQLTPFDKFPINDYDVDDPGVIFENWTLTVSGAVQKPGEYRLNQIQDLPRVRQNTRHVCVEGWDVIGRFGGAKLSDFLTLIGADTSARFITVGCADDYYESLDMATAHASANTALLRNVRPSAYSRAWRSPPAQYPNENRIQAGEVSYRSKSHQHSRQRGLLGRSRVFVVLRTLEKRSWRKE